MTPSPSTDPSTDHGLDARLMAGVAAGQEQAFVDLYTRVQFRLQGVPDALDMGSRTEDLGEQVLEGLTTRGGRTTRTIAAGAVGNERAIEIVTEQWYAPDIDAVVLRRGPRFGEVVYRLVNVVQGEPAATLFAVPSGYEVSDDAGVPWPPGAPPLPGGRFERRILVAPAPGQ